MSKATSQLADWAVRKIEREYSDDVCLLLGHRTHEFDWDQGEMGFSFYIPATSRSNGLARTFIVDGIGYDLFPMTWERVERIAEFRGDSPVCLSEAEILYARNDDDRQRFTSLQARLRANLQNPHFMYNRALESLDAAMSVYQEMLFEQRLWKVREHAGYICIRLSDSIAFANQRYFSQMQTGQIGELLSMNNVPAGFTDLYGRVIRTRAVDEQKRLCHEMIASVRAFLAEHDKNEVGRPSSPDFSELAFWYQELSYTWLRIYYWCDKNDPVNAYVWCCLLQNELDSVGSEYGIADLDVFSAFDADNLPVFRKRCEAVEQGIVAAIEANGATIESYPSVDDFLEKNR